MGKATQGITFGNVHSYEDLDLILSKSEISPALPKTNYIDIQGGNGSLDMTEATGEVTFYDRDCSFTFTMKPDGDLSDAAFEDKKTEVSNFLAGKSFQITLDKDEDHFYKGRFVVNNYLSDKRIRQIVVTGKLAPFKMKQSKTIIKYDLTGTEKTYNIINSRLSVIPQISCTHDNSKIVFNGNIFTLNAGTHEVLDIIFTEGTNQLKLSGTGTITFEFHEGNL